MIKKISETWLPEGVTLESATVNATDMDERSISATVTVPEGKLVYEREWEVEFRGERYVMPLREPGATVDAEAGGTTVDVTFEHWAIRELKRWMFFTVQARSELPDKYESSVELNLRDFCDLLGVVLKFYYGDTIYVDLADGAGDGKAVKVDISYSYIWDVIKGLYDAYGVRWELACTGLGSAWPHGRYALRVGYDGGRVDHVFECGFAGGLLKIERQMQSDEIRNMLLGRGGTQNLPRYYYKESPDEGQWHGDPDWVEELKNIHFDRLRGATFRSYVQGWKAAHKADYPGYEALYEEQAYAPWAYKKGYTDAKFDPVEYVADEIVADSAARQVQLTPTFSPWVKKDSSIDRYGPLLGAVESDDDIYPSIQGSGMDIVVGVEQIKSDDVEESTAADAVLTKLGPVKATAQNVKPRGMATVVLYGAKPFRVARGRHANLTVNLSLQKVTENGEMSDTLLLQSMLGPYTVTVENVNTGKTVSASGIPEGTWRWRVQVQVNNTSDRTLSITVGDPAPQLTDADVSNTGWKNTFDVWVKDIWGSSRKDGESNSQYAERVWRPILGDREGNTARMMFTSGMLLHEDYEFTIVSIPEYDASRSYMDADGVRHQSCWRIRLAKSDAELEATGLYVPSTQKQGKAGDTFVFIGIEMPHEYVLWAERRLEDNKKDILREKKDGSTQLVVTTDRVRLSNSGEAGALIDELWPGRSLRVADSRLLPGVYETLYLQSMTWTFRTPSPDDAALNPDVEIVLSDKYETTMNAVGMIQGEIDTLHQRMGSYADLEKTIMAVCDKLYLRKDGVADRSISPTQFHTLLTSGDFRSGISGGAGWGFYKDANGNWVLETDNVNVRQEMQVNTLVINQALGRGGMEIDSAAAMEVSMVEDTELGYVCHFDQKDGSVANLFRPGDVAYCNRWTPENGELKFYKRKVIATDVDSITLTKGYDPEVLPDGTIDTGVNGSGIPAEKDCIIHYGNYGNARRQFVKVRDVVGGGYERYIEGLDSVNAKGREYYFVGRQEGQYNDRPRFYLGDENGYIEWQDGEMNIMGRLNIKSPVGDGSQTLGGLISDMKSAGFVLRLSNEMAGVLCDADGNVTGPMPKCKATVYNGTRPATGVSRYSAVGTGVSAMIWTTGELVLFGMTEDKASVEVTATVDGVTLTASMNLYKVRAGANGESAVVYSLEPNVGNVTRSMSGAMSAEKVNCTVYKTSGDTGMSPSNDHTLTYERLPDGAKGTLSRSGGVSADVPLLADTTAVVFELKSGNIVLDRQRVPVLSDAGDLEVGGRNLLRDTTFETKGQWEFHPEASIDPSVKYMGHNSVKLDVRGYSDYSYRRIYQYITTAAVHAGDVMTLSLYALTDNTATADKDILMAISCYDIRGEQLKSESISVLPKDNGVWEKKVLRRVIPSGTMLVRVTITAEQNGRVWINSPKLEFGNVATDWSPAPEDVDARFEMYDYLRNALKESTTISGGLIQSSVLLLGYTTLYGFEVQCGMNGLTRGGRTVASWWGGDMVDLAVYPSVSGAATALVRMDGTAYFCNNVIRLEGDYMMVGENVRLGREGLSMLNDSGRKFVLSNESIGEFNPAEVNNRIALSRTSLQMGYIRTSVEENTGTVVVGSLSTTDEIVSGVKTGDMLHLTVALRLAADFGATNETSCYTRVRFSLLDKNGVRVKTSETALSFISDIQLVAEADMGTILKTEGSYRLKVEILGASNISDAEAVDATAYCWLEGYVERGVSDMMMIGNDGVALSWNKTKLFMNESGIYMISGNHAMRITAAGIERNSNGGSGTWTPM